MLALAACQSPQVHGPAVVPVAARAEHTVEQPPRDKGAAEPAATVPGDLWQRIRTDLNWQTVDNDRVDRAREQFLRQSTYLPMIADRANYYLYYIVDEVQKRDMPMEIALVPMIESTLDPFASSASGAAGLWQIMPGTGRHLGLEQDAWYDGRQAVRDSTTVALDYLESLYEEFDEDWLLALAAYNSGQGRVASARRANAKKGLDTDYWSLKLPRQTRNYVPRVIALAQIVADPDQFGVQLPAVENAPAFEVANTGGRLALSQAAELAGVDLDIVRALNPGQLRGTISPGRPPELLLPVGTRDQFEQGVAQLEPQDFVQWRYYRIKPGDTLGQIALRFGTDTGLLRQINGIRGSLIRAGATLKIPGGSSQDFSQLLASSAGAATPRGYRVRHGDSLYGIADRFNVTIKDIIAWNALDPDAYLQPGQQLTLYLKDG